MVVPDLFRIFVSVMNNLNKEEKIIELIKKIGQWVDSGYIYHIDPIRINPTQEIIYIGVYEQYETGKDALLACAIDNDDDFEWLSLFGEVDKYYKEAFDEIIDEFDGILNNIGNITKIN